MNKEILKTQDIKKNERFLGTKTLNLNILRERGFNVPEFLALPSYSLKRLKENNEIRKNISGEVSEFLNADRYAVRSSAFVEDDNDFSYAGQFLSRLNIAKEDLPLAIFEVIRQAEDYFGGDLSRFSVIIQRCVKADIAGVAFTRNPKGTPEMVIEYGACDGARVVGGEVRPNSISFYWNEQAGKRPEFLTDNLIGQFKKIEHLFNFPQDIEWCIRDGRFYLLQARPITTISKKQYEQILYLDRVLPKNVKYYYEKTAISEITPRPSNLTLGVLKRIYSKNGPVDLVYKKYKISYQTSDFLKVIGNELFVDREKEAKSLMPAYSCLHSEDYNLKFRNFKNILPSLKNAFFINKIKTKNCDELFKSLKMKIEDEVDEVDFKTALDRFLRDYETVFEANLLSGLSLKRIEVYLKKEKISALEILEPSPKFVDWEKYKVKMPSKLTGNSINLSDEEKFFGHEDVGNEKQEKITDWWEKVPEFRKRLLRPLIAEAMIYNRLREFGRWLAVKNMNCLKDALLKLAKETGFENVKNIYFADLDDVLKCKADESSCVKNKNTFESYSDFNIPSPVTSSLIIKRTATQGVSSGKAEGVLVEKKNVGLSDFGKDKILYTENLSPDLVKYFDAISGIVSENGGLLSHLAILAREKGLPVVVGFSFARSNIEIGDRILIDGNIGKILKIRD